MLTVLTVKKPPDAIIVIKATIALYNIKRFYQPNETVPENPVEDEENDDIQIIGDFPNAPHNQQFRNQLIGTFPHV